MGAIRKYEHDKGTRARSNGDKTEDGALVAIKARMAVPDTRESIIADLRRDPNNCLLVVRNCLVGDNESDYLVGIGNKETGEFKPFMAAECKSAFGDSCDGAKQARRLFGEIKSRKLTSSAVLDPFDPDASWNDLVAESPFFVDDLACEPVTKENVTIRFSAISRGAVSKAFEENSNWKTSAKATGLLRKWLMKRHVTDRFYGDGVDEGAITKEFVAGVNGLLSPEDAFGEARDHVFLYGPSSC